MVRLVLDVHVWQNRHQISIIRKRLLVNELAQEPSVFCYNESLQQGIEMAKSARSARSRTYC